MTTEAIKHDKSCDAIKRNINLAEYIRNRCNVEFKPKGKELLCKCPFPDHKDGKPSFSVNIDKNLFQCFGCGRKGSIIDFVKDYDNLSLAETLKKLSLNNKNLPSSFSVGTAEKNISVNQCSSVVEKTKGSLLSLSPVAEFYHKTLFGKDSKGLEYLKKRNINDIETLKHFQAGYVNGTLLKTLSAKQKKALKECNLITEKGTEFFLGCVVFPMLNDQGEVVSFYGRSITADDGGHFYLPGSRTGLINAKSAKVYDNIVLTESVIDAVSAFQAGVKNVIPCYGTNGFTADHEKLLCTSQLSGGTGRKPVIIAFDNDKPGRRSSLLLLKNLKEKGVTACSANLPDEVKDVNDFFAYNREFDCRRTPEEFKQLIILAARQAVSYKEIPGRPRDKSELHLIKHNSSELVYGIDDVIYKLRGLYLNSLTSLKLVVTASPAESNKKRLASSITDRFDLYLARNRKSFAYRVQEKLDRPVSRVENDLDKLIPRLEVLREEHRKPSESKREEHYEMSPSEKKEALAFLRSPQLLKRITSDIETIGYVGEDTAKLLVYLIATSRKLEKPQSCIIRSESGSGKSFLMECVAELMPNEDVEFFSRLTPQSLYYMDRDRLKHKLLIVDERDGSDDAEYSIRTLQTRRKLTLAVPAKDDKGQITTIEKVINGPIAYMESTTAQNINPENANRCFEIFLDEASEETLRVFEKQRDIRTLAGWKQDLKRQNVTNLHQNAQRLLKNVKVIIPYVHEIKFPSNWMRNRRDHDRFLCLIEAVAFLHQYQRDRKSANGTNSKTLEECEEYIEANLDDYETAYNLALTVFTSSHHDLPKNTLGVFFQLKKMVEEKAKEQKIRVGELWFRRRELREFSKLQDHQLKRTLRTLTDLEYLNVKRSGNGGTYHYRLSGTITNPDVMKGVTTPVTLRNLFNAKTQGCKELRG